MKLFTRPVGRDGGHPTRIIVISEAAYTELREALERMGNRTIGHDRFDPIEAFGGINHDRKPVEIWNEAYHVAIPESEFRRMFEEWKS